MLSFPTLSALFRQKFPFWAGLGISLFILLTNFNNFWLGADDGYYAHTAERFINGEIPHMDFHEIHPGYVLWIHAAALKLFGISTLSLRYPLLLLSIIQLVLVWQLLHKAGRWPAMTGMILVTSLGLPACPNPTANLYALFFAIASFRVADEPDLLERPRKLVLLGIMLGLCVLFRHLSGILLGCGLIVWLFSHPRLQQVSPNDVPNHSIAGRLLLLMAFVGTAGYSVNRSDIIGIVLFALPAVTLALFATLKAKPDRRKVWKIVGALSTGLFLAFLPLLIYLSVNGIWQVWIRDIVILPMSLIAMPFFDKWHYSDLLFTVGASISDITNGLFAINYLTWIGLVVLPGMISWVIVKRFLLQFRNIQSSSGLPAFVISAPFFGLSGLHFEIPLYLIWSIPPLLLAGLLLWSKPSGLQKAGLTGLLIITIGSQLSVVGAPVWERPFTSLITILPGDIRADIELKDRAQINLSADEADFYRRSLAIIEKNTSPSETIFSFPSHPQWYFLAARKNPTPHIFSGVSINSEYLLISIQESFSKSPPAMIIHKTDDKYGNGYTERLRRWLDQSYKVLHSGQLHQY